MSEAKEGKGSGRARTWCFTAQSPDTRALVDGKWVVDDEDALAPLDSDVFYQHLAQNFYWDELWSIGQSILPNSRNSPLRYLCWQGEICPQTRRFHIQGYCEFSAPVRMGAVKKFLNNSTIHLEPRRGTKEEARAYCSKPETRAPGSLFCEFGAQIMDGERTDLAAFVNDVKEGKDDVDLVETHPSCFVRYNKAADRIRAAYAQRRTQHRRRLDVFLLYGPPGCGKTHKAIEWSRNASKTFFLLTEAARASGGSTVWFDGYHGQQVLIIDDLNSDWLPEQLLLSLLEKHPASLQFKGGTTAAVWDTVYITSNYRFKDWFISKLDNGTHGYKNDKALGRRISKIIDMTNNVVPVQPVFEPPEVRIEDIDPSHPSFSGSQQDPIVIQ